MAPQSVNVRNAVMRRITVSKGKRIEAGLYAEFCLRQTTYVRRRQSFIWDRDRSRPQAAYPVPLSEPYADSKKREAVLCLALYLALLRVGFALPSSLPTKR